MDYQVQEFIYLRPAFIAVIIFLFALLTLIFSRKRFLTRFSFFSILFICFSVSSILLISSGYIVDAYGLGGDAPSFYMWLAIVGLSVINIFVFLRKESLNSTRAV
ncbi:group-specific protein [Bacillus freudenreichii]|nr:group-specific protein [Bacillus freudenreichii]